MYEDYREERAREAEEAGFHVKDSGAKAQYADGMQRDSTEGKPRFDLLIPTGMPYEETLLYRAAMHYMLGGKKYGDRNWEKSSTPESLEHHNTALWRHFMKFASGTEDGEDHAAAIFWNLNAVLYTRWRISQVSDDDLDDEVTDLPDKDRPETDIGQSLSFQPPGKCYTLDGVRWVRDPTGGAWIHNEDGIYSRITGDSIRESDDFPKFGTPEFDAQAEEVAAEQAKDWPKYSEVKCPCGRLGCASCDYKEDCDVTSQGLNPSDAEVALAKSILEQRAAFHAREAQELLPKNLGDERLNW